MQLHKVLQGLSVLSAITSPMAIAAVDGQIGDTSSGRVVIRLDLNQGIQIANLQDIEISVSGQATEDVVTSHRFCVRASARSYSTARHETTSCSTARSASRRNSR